MHASLRASGAPRRAWVVTWVVLAAGAAVSATRAMRNPGSPIAAPQLGGFGFPPLMPRRGADTDEERDRKAFMEQLAVASEVVENAAKRSSEALRSARQILVDLEAKDPSRFDPDYPERIKALKAKIDEALVGKLREEAKALASAPGTTPSQGLAKYAEAEDLIRKTLLNAKQSRSPSYAGYEEVYKALLQDSDDYSKRVVRKELIESVPWKDLLSDEMAMKWSKTTTVPGFACRIKDGVLTISPPDAGSKMQGVCGILDQKNDNLRHFMLDMEFTVDGVATMFFHVSPPPQNPDNRQSETYDLSSKDGGLKPNGRYHLVATYIGSDLVVSFPEDDDIQRYENTPNWAKLRRGGIVFLIPESTRLRVTRMRIKDLR